MNLLEQNGVIFFYSGALKLLARTFAEERYKRIDDHCVQFSYWSILFIIEWVMCIRFGKAPLHTSRKLEACQRQKSLQLMMYVENVLSEKNLERLMGI